MPQQQKLSFFSRIGLAFIAFWRTLFNREFALGVRELRRRGLIAIRAAEPAPVLKEASPDAALQLLELLQREGRLVDFVQEDVAMYSDAEIGAAVRVVHEGCRRVLREHFAIEPVRDGQEGSRVTLEAGFDPSAIRLTGNVVGEPPFHGVLAHRGWRVVDVRLPKIAATHDVRVLAPAEVEL